MIRCSICAGLTSAPMVPATRTVVTSTRTMSLAAADEVVVSSVFPSGKVIETTSPAWMSGVTSSPVPAPQHAPPGWLISNATSVPDTRTLAEPMTVEPRFTWTSASSPAYRSYPSTETKSRSGKTTTLSGKDGTTAPAGCMTDMLAATTPRAAVMESTRPRDQRPSRSGIGVLAISESPWSGGRSLPDERVIAHHGPGRALRKPCAPERTRQRHSCADDLTKGRRRPGQDEPAGDTGRGVRQQPDRLAGRPPSPRSRRPASRRSRPPHSCALTTLLPG